MNVHEPNPRFPHHCVIKRRTDDGDPMTDEDNDVVIYNGVCRSFSFHTTSETGEVITSTRKLSLPVKQNEWNSTNIPQEGDLVVVSKNGYEESGTVIDKMPGNLGTHVLWKFVRN